MRVRRYLHPDPDAPSCRYEREETGVAFECISSKTCPIDVSGSATPRGGLRVADKTERELSTEDVREIAGRLKSFLEPFQKLLTREEQRAHAEAYIEGRSRLLTRRTSEPIAIDRGNKRRPLQHFVGAGRWEDGKLRDEMCRRIGAELGSPNGVLILDGSGFPKTGPHSVGTQRQWCGRLGKEEQCQVGEFLVYAAKGSVALADCELYLPTGHSTESAAKLATSRKRWSFKRGGSWPRKWCWAVGKCCLTVG